MKKKTKIFVIAIVGVLLVGVLLGYIASGFFQCYTYYEIIAASPRGLANLSGPNGTFHVPIDNNAPAFSLGYTQIGIDPFSINAINYVGDTGADVVIDCNEYSLMLFSPWASTPPSIQRGWVHSAGLVRLMSEDPSGYLFAVRAANTMPNRYTRIFFMRQKHFAEYIALAAVKSQNVMNRNGTAVFETDHVRGIVRFGQAPLPRCFELQIFAKNSNVGHTAFVFADSPQKIKEFLPALLASYRFLVTQPPDKDTLRRLINAEIEKHDKFSLPRHTGQ
ncbi:MAG: hypothetical protein ACYST6_06085 [Planctomycetota bacterium]|jgi:hypothetical protein